MTPRTSTRTNRPGLPSVVGFELRKLAAQRRSWITLVATAVLPFLLVAVLQGQARPPKDTIFGRFIHESGWSIPLLLLGFAGQWFLPLLTSIVAGDIFASEDHNGTWKTVLTRSVSRTQLFFGKVIVAVGFALFAYALLGVCTVAASLLIIGHQPLSGLSGQMIPSADAARLVAESWASVAAPIVGFTGLAMMLSVLTRNVAAGIAAPVALGLVMQLVGAVGGLNFIRPLLLTTPLETWHGLFASPHFNSPLVFGLAVSAAWSFVTITIAYVVFRRRDYQG